VNHSFADLLRLLQAKLMHIFRFATQQIFHKETGVSWNKKFRKKHGSIAKFLRSCSDTFEVDTENDIVLLKDTATVRVDHAVFSAASNQKNHVIKDDVSKVKDTDHLSNGLTNKEDSSSSSSTDGAIVNDQIEDSCHDCVEMGSAGWCGSRVCAGVDVRGDERGGRLGALFFQ